MRVVFGLLGLVVTLLVVVQLVKTQTATSAPARVPPTVVAPSDANLPTLQGSPKQLQEQYQQALDDALKAGQKRLETANKP